MTIRGFWGLGAIRPVLGFFQRAARARDQSSPFSPLWDQTANRERSNGELKLTIRSPFLMEFQKAVLTNDERLVRLSSVCAGKYSTDASVGGLLLYRCRSFSSGSETSSRWKIPSATHTYLEPTNLH